MRVPINRRGLSFAADKGEIRAGGEGELKKRNYAPKSVMNGTGLSSRFQCVVLKVSRYALKESRRTKIQTSTLPLGALHLRFHGINRLPM